MKPILLATIALASIALPLAATPASVTLTVDTARPAQEILGFGASGAWWSLEIGAWPEAQRREIMRLLYDKQTGLGLTIYRYNLGADTQADTDIPVPKRRIESMLNTKTGRYDWSRDANARRVMREALEAGASEVILFVNSPPINMTKNGRGYGTPPPDGTFATNLAAERYADFASYLGEVTEHFLRVDKLPVVAVSPVNEPEWQWDKPKQEGCHYTPAETAAVTKAVYDEIKRRGLPVRVEGPEGGNWESTIPYFEAINAIPELRAGMKDFAVHSYWRKPGQKEKLRAWLDKNRPDARLHMSEWCEMKPGPAPDMDSALVLADTIIEDFTLGRVSTWQYWVALNYPIYHSGFIYYDNDTRQFTPTKRYYAFAQFTRYLAKGSVVLPLKTPSTEKQIRAMAARLPDGRVAVICANLSANEKNLDIHFPKNETWQLQLRALTDDNHNNTVTAADGASNAFPAHSVVTIIFQKKPAP